MAAFVVHMHMAWLYVLHARLSKFGVDYRYPDPQHPRRYLRVDGGDFKFWELKKCVEDRWADFDHPVRRNLEFFIALRNRIEHRHDRSPIELMIALSGRVQAHLLNYEEELSSMFGIENSLTNELRFPIFVGSFTREGDDALQALREKLPASLKRFISRYDAGLPTEVVDDSRFELRLNVVLNQVQRGNDAMAIQFIRWSDVSAEQKAQFEELGKQGRAIIREQKRPVIGHGFLRPRDAERRVAKNIPFVFNSYHFMRAWQIKGIRPKTGSSDPERTDERYCVYDELSNSYGYTEAWVDWLVRHCGTAEEFESVTGRAPKSS
jgi:hypothetical protein